MNHCKKCNRSLHMCDVCDGQRKKSFLNDTLSCKNCNSTGLICPQHKGHWK
jgi:hypothetical protein